jgi:hypothetical protein
MIQYRDLIKNFFKSHAQINTVKTGNQFNFNAKSNIIYPVAHAEFINQQGKSYNFLITIADKFDPNLEDSEEYIYSDCNEIADDAIAHFANQVQPDYIINEEARIEKFNNGHTDKIAGCTFLLTFTEDNVLDACAVPNK